MKAFVSRHFVPAMLAVMFLFVILPFFESASRIVKSYERAIDWGHVEVLTPTIRPGDTLELIYRSTINKQCPSDIRGFLVAEDGSVPVRFPTVAGGYAKPADEETPTRVNIMIPMQSDSGLSPLKSGRYIYRSISTRYCPDGIEDDNATPDAAFYLEVQPGK